MSSTKLNPTTAIGNANTNTPLKHNKQATARPPGLFGTRSPYPNVVNVTMTKYMATGMSTKVLSSLRGLPGEQPGKRIPWELGEMKWEMGDWR